MNLRHIYVAITCVEHVTFFMFSKATVLISSTFLWSDSIWSIDLVSEKCSYNI